MNKLSLALVALSLSLASAQAAPKTFKVGAGRPTMQLATVDSHTDLEAMTGRTDKVSGSLTFDPAKKSGSGRIVVDAASIDTGIDLRDEHMRGKMWLDVEEHPTIEFQTTNVKWVSGDTYTVTGKFTMHGVTKTLTTKATVKYMPGSAKTKAAGFAGDVLLVKTSFSVKLSDFGITIPAAAQGKISNAVTISVSAYGQSGA